MILSRVIHHFRKQEWIAIAIDFFIVVIGVFIGIQVSNWNDARQEHAEQQQVEVRLRSDFRGLDEALTGALNLQEGIILALNTLRTAIERGEAMSDEDEAIKTAIVKGVAYPSFPRKSATYNELVSSGRLHLVKSDALRNALSFYNESIDNSLYNIQQARATIGGDVSILYKYATLTPVEPGNVGIQSATGYDIAAMAQDREFRRRIDAIIVAQTWVYINLAAQKQSIDAVLDAMGEEQ